LPSVAQPATSLPAMPAITTMSITIRTTITMRTMHDAAIDTVASLLDVLREGVAVKRLSLKRSENHHL
jgi:hypothetical protein